MVRIKDERTCKELSDKELLGEHYELHIIYGVLTKGLKGYSKHPEVLRFKNNLSSLELRHKEQIREFKVRGFKHKSPLKAKTK